MSLASVDRYDRDRVPQVGAHAVVMGASMAGLLAARVLADAFEHVTIVDRDQIDEATGVRRGVPQGQHVHVLLSAGEMVMEDLEPGFGDELTTAGAPVLDLSREFVVHAADGFVTPGEAEIPLHFPTRPLLERLLRARITKHDRVTLRPGCQVTDYLPAEDDRGLAGIEVREDGARTTIPAELVVDATGRGTRTPTWLERLGYPAPATETVTIDLAYRTCQVTRPPEDRRAMLIMPSPPRARGGAMFPVEDDRWLVTLAGMHGDHPPDDIDGLRAFADGLPTPTIHEVLDEHPLATPDVARYRFPSSTRRRYDRLEEQPRGLLAVGDAVASFNPIYGQGMSVAALEALALHHALADSELATLGPAFHERAAPIVDGAWNMAVGGDFGFPQTEGDKPPATDLVNRYITRLHRKAHSDAWLAEAFDRVVVMEQPTTSLFRPRVAWRVLRPGLPDAAA